MTRDIILSNLGNDLILNVSNSKADIVKSVTDPFLLSDESVKRINDTLDDEMRLGMAKNPERESSLQMANTFIPKHLSGDEKGEFLALDLGGTNFRVILLKLNPEKELDTIVQYFTVPDHLRLGEGAKLFDFLAECIQEFLKMHDLLDVKLPLGFCFSFPMIQTGIDEGILVTWTKSFNAPNVVGKEVVQMLRHSISKTDISADVIAIINDTTGTLMMGSYLDKNTAIGLILGTGCNAAYFEKVKCVEKWEGEHAGIEEVIIDTEWGAFGDNGVLDFMKTDFDFAVNKASLLVDSFTFEKLLSGKYIGDIVHQILLRLMEKGVLFEDKNTRPSTWNFAAADVSYTMGKSGRKDIIAIMESKGFLNVTEEDAEIIHYVCTVVSIRGSLIVSICLANLLKRINKENVTIAVDGSLFKLHPKYQSYMEKFISTLAPNNKFQFILAEDGSGKGAGLVAAVVKTLDTSKLHA